MAARRETLAKEHGDEIRRATSQLEFLQGHIDAWSVDATGQPTTKVPLAEVPPMPDFGKEEFSTPLSHGVCDAVSATAPGASSTLPKCAADTGPGPSAPPVAGIDPGVPPSLLSLLRKNESEKITHPSDHHESSVVAP